MIGCRRVRRIFNLTAKNKMIKLKMFNRKLLLAKCLLAVYLFFSFIIIAGYNGSSNSIFRQTGQTALVCLGKSITNKTVLYRASLLQRNQTTSFSHHNNLISLLIYNALDKVKLDSHSKKIYSILIPKRLLPINNISQDSREDYFTSFPS